MSAEKGEPPRESRSPSATCWLAAPAAGDSAFHTVCESPGQMAYGGEIVL
jgi:hypothetical protein